MNYPFLTPQSQPMRPYNGIASAAPPSHFYERTPNREPITLGVPLLPQQSGNLPSQGSSYIPASPVPQMINPHILQPQPQRDYPSTGYPSQPFQIQNKNYNVLDQNADHVNFLNKNIPEQPYVSLNITRENTQIVSEPNTSYMLYQQLPGSMAPPYTQSCSMTEGNSGPIVYDLSLLNKITSREPQLAYCPCCNKHVQTVVNYEVGTGTIMSGVFMGCLGGISLLCSWVPCCIKDMKDAVHHCPLCGKQIGKKKFLIN